MHVAKNRASVADCRKFWAVGCGIPNFRAKENNMQKPMPGEYRPYAQLYMDQVPEGDITEILQQTKVDTIRFFKSLPVEKHTYSYAPGKWTVKQVLLHIIDTERVLSYRALVGARGDTHTVIHSMNENLYADNATAANRTMEDLLEEFEAVRNASQQLFRHVSDEESVLRTNNYDGTYFTPRSLAYFIAGHGLHHIRVLKERY